MTDFEEQPEPQSSGCLTAILQLIAVIVIVMTVFLTSCVIIIGRLFPDAPIKTTSRMELPSPDGGYMAVLYQREQPGFLNMYFWTELAIRKGLQEEMLIGSMGREKPDVRWTENRKLLVVLHARPSLQVKAHAFGVGIVYHLSDDLHVGVYLKLLQRIEEHGDDPRQILTQELLRPGVTAAVEAAGRTAAARAAC